MLKNKNKKQQGSNLNEITSDDVAFLLKRIINPDVADNYSRFLTDMGVKELKISADNTAALIIDPQRSFTKGFWMQSIGALAELEVKPIQAAFEKCAQFLSENSGVVETMFTRCPFPPGSFDWDDVFTGIIDSKQPYFIKPGNSVFFPPGNGFREWVGSLIDDGKNQLVMAGCTLNSCVRVSSIETQKHFQDRKLQVVVDLNLCGARTHNFIPSSLYGGLSAVESAVREMIDAGVRVARCVLWTR
jgi:hypothetical protein